MGKHRTLEERLAHAEKLVERNARSMERRDKRAKRFKDKGQYEAATKECQHYERAERLHKKWDREVRRIRQQIRVRDALQARAPESGRGEERVLSPAEQRRLERDLKDRRIREEQKRKKLSAADVDYDTRTALGRRTYDIINFGPKMRASVNHFNACIRKTTDRTDVRLLAWQEFDRHYHKVSAGLIASPRFEPGVDTSSIPGVSDSRLDALSVDATLRAVLGVHLHTVLVEVVYHQRHPRELPGLANLERQARSVLLLHALDLAAIHWGLDRVKRVKTRHSSVALDSAPSD